MFDLRIASTELELSGLKLSEVDGEANVRTPEHTHAETHFCLALEGRCFETCQGNTFEHGRFTVSFLPADLPHLVNYGESRFRWFRMTVSSTWMQRFDGYIHTSLQRTSSSCGKINDLFLRIHEEYRSPDMMSPLVIEALTCEMFAEVVRHKTQTDQVNPRWLVQARDYVEANFLKQVRLDKIAEEVDVHPVHLAREFRRYFNCTIGEYIRSKRIEFVRCQLVSSDAPVVEIALAAGFCDQSHLTRIFKNVTGVTPAQYRMMSSTR